MYWNKLLPKTSITQNVYKSHNRRIKCTKLIMITNTQLSNHFINNNYINHHIGLKKHNKFKISSLRMFLSKRNTHFNICPYQQPWYGQCQATENIITLLNY